MARARESRRVGLARALSKLGICSRSRASALICEGRVRLNGVLRRDPETPVHLDRDRIDLDGERVAQSAAYIYLMLNKPRGIVTTAADEKGRATVYSLLADSLPWIAPVGRLDKASEGLLLLTNDSKWAARITDPDSHLNKTYHVHVRGRASDIPLSTLCSGISQGGHPLRAKSATVLRAGEKNTWVEIVLDEGKNRHIRRLFDALGFEILRLVRTSIGPLALGQLPKAKSRPLSAQEKAALDATLKDRKR